uniref:Uncharacterized protein n=1 Tax=mine drainage metagenome TaxID=410659 RepID=E6Q9W0_9ZZZZ
MLIGEVLGFVEQGVHTLFGHMAALCKSFSLLQRVTLHSDSGDVFALCTAIFHAGYFCSGNLMIVKHFDSLMSLFPSFY